MFVKLDAQTGALEVHIPPHLEQYRESLEAAVMEEYAFEPLNHAALAAIDSFICSWFKAKGIVVPENRTGNGKKE